MPKFVKTILFPPILLCLLTRRALLSRACRKFLAPIGGLTKRTCWGLVTPMSQDLVSVGSKAPSGDLTSPPQSADAPAAEPANPEPTPLPAKAAQEVTPPSRGKGVQYGVSACDETLSVHILALFSCEALRCPKLHHRNSRRPERINCSSFRSS